MAGYDNDELSVDDLLAAFGAPGSSSGAASRPKSRTKKPSGSSGNANGSDALADGEIDLLAALGLASPQQRASVASQPADRQTVREASRREQQIRSQQWQQELRRREERIARAQAAQNETDATPVKSAGPVVEEGGFRRSTLPQGLSEGTFEQIEPFNIPEPSFLQGGIQSRTNTDTAATSFAQQKSALDSVPPGFPEKEIEASTTEQSVQQLQHPSAQSQSPRDASEFRQNDAHSNFVPSSTHSQDQLKQAYPAQSAISDMPSEQPVDTFSPSVNTTTGDVRSPMQYPAPEPSQMLQPFNPNIGPTAEGFFNRKVVVPSEQPSLSQENGETPGEERVAVGMEAVERRTFSFAPVAGEPVIQRLDTQSSQVTPSTFQSPIDSTVAESAVVAEGVAEAPLELSNFESASTPQADVFNEAEMISTVSADTGIDSSDVAPLAFPAPDAQTISQQVQAPPADLVPAPAPIPAGMPMNTGSAPFASRADMPSSAMPPVSMGATGPMGSPVTPFEPAPQPFISTPPIDAPVPSQTDIETNATGSKRNSILGIVLIVVALLCAVMAIGLLSGMFNMLQPAPEPSKAASGAIQSSAAESDADTPQSTTEAVYTYVVRGVDGTTHEATETAVFDENNILQQSTIEIDVENADVANALLAQLTDEFGTSVTASDADDNHVQITLDINRDDLTKEAYTELLSANMTEFKQVQ